MHPKNLTPFLARKMEIQRLSIDAHPGLLCQEASALLVQLLAR